MKVLVAYFSATGRTRKVALQLSEKLKAELYEIEPKVPYKIKDLNWLNPFSRSSKEMKYKIKPEIVEKKLQIEEYDVIYLGFPIWWYVAPTIINTFLEKYDWTNKKIILFATSGSSGFGKTKEALEESVKNALIIEGKVIRKKDRIEDFIREFQ